MPAGMVFLIDSGHVDIDMKTLHWFKTF